MAFADEESLVVAFKDLVNSYTPSDIEQRRQLEQHLPTMCLKDYGEDPYDFMFKLSTLGDWLLRCGSDRLSTREKRLRFFIDDCLPITAGYKGCVTPTWGSFSSTWQLTNMSSVYIMDGMSRDQYKVVLNMLRLNYRRIMNGSAPGIPAPPADASSTTAMSGVALAGFFAPPAKPAATGSMGDPSKPHCK